MATNEYILCAAINYNEIIICGHRHGDCYDIIEKLVGKIETNKLPNRDKQGFLTSLNRYVGREEAWTIAIANDQVVYGLKASSNDRDILLEGLEIDYSPEILISENLY